MSKTCPNCMRPVRSGVNYCGYCGASLVPTPRDPSPTLRSSSKATHSDAENTAPKSQRTRKTGKGGRSWIRVPITLLILVILAALAVRYWPEIQAFIGQAIPLLKLS